MHGNARCSGPATIRRLSGLPSCACLPVFPLSRLPPCSPPLLLLPCCTGFSEQHRTSTWKDCTQAVTVLYTPGWEETLRLVLRGRPAAGQEAAALILRFARHAALDGR